MVDKNVMIVSQSVVALAELTLEQAPVSTILVCIEERLFPDATNQSSFSSQADVRSYQALQLKLSNLRPPPPPPPITSDPLPWLHTTN